VQLYTVRDLIATDAAATIAAIAAMGYTEIEILQPTLPLVGPLAQRHGLSMVSAHLDGPTAMGQGLNAFLDRAQAYGLRYIVVPYVPPDERPRDRAGFERIADRLSRMGDEVARAGMQLCYHNHAFEFGRDADGRRFLDTLMQASRAPQVQLELDVFWVAITGADPVELLEEYAGRVALVHLKDKAADAPAVLLESDVARTAFRDVGAGSLDVPAILAAARAAGVRHFFVEHDHPENPLGSLTNSFRYLAGLERP
jgi:sugar phosphate isomerase/epimerase